MRLITSIIVCFVTVSFGANHPAVADCVVEVDISGLVLISGTDIPLGGVQICMHDFCGPAFCLPEGSLCINCTNTDYRGLFNLRGQCQLTDIGAHAVSLELCAEKPGYIRQCVPYPITIHVSPDTCFTRPSFLYFVVFLEGETSGILDESQYGTLVEFTLAQNYPNPFNLGTTIEFTLIKPAEASLLIYDILGRCVKKRELGNCQRGKYAIPFEGRDDSGEPLQSGIYFYRLIAGGFADTKKMILLK